MNKKEFAVFVAALKTFYPRENLLPNQQAAELWYRELCDLPYNVAETALREYVHLNKWPPTIADIRERAAGIRNGASPDWGEGWNQLQAAIRRYGVYRPEEAVERLKGTIREVVERLGFRELCLSENVTADRARFKDLYEKIAERKRKDEQLSQSVRLLAEKIRSAEQLALEEGKEQKEGF